LPCASDENLNEIYGFCSFPAILRSFIFATHCANEVEQSALLVPYEKNHQPVHSVYQLHLSRENLRQNGRHENRNKSLSFLPALSNWNAPPMVRKSCAKHASLPKKPANLFRMFIVAAYPTLHRRLADGLAALQFHLCLSGVFSRWALNRMFQNETKPVLETVKVTPHVHCVVREKPGRRLFTP
jgi:hypothetical protein